MFLFIVAGWIVSLCLHEYAHALFAYRFGDHGVAIRGYLRLDPLKYANPLFSIVIPVIFMLLGGIALPGGAVLVDNAALRTRRRQAIVSLAGPAINAIFAFLLMIPFLAGVGTRIQSVFTLDQFYAEHGAFWSALALSGVLPADGGDPEPAASARPRRRQRHLPVPEQRLEARLTTPSGRTASSSSSCSSTPSSAPGSET